MTTLIIPARRDVKAMTALFETIDISQRLSAAFKDELYGVFSVTGRAHTSTLADDLLIAGLMLASKGKPSRNVQDCDYAEVLSDSAGTESSPVRGGLDGDTTDTLRRVKHGDLLRVAQFGRSPTACSK